MQPVGNLFAKFPRTVRDLARQMGKTIELEVGGTEVELDKSVLELLSDPLTHLIRNCCDHGLELPDQRAERANGGGARGAERSPGGRPDLHRSPRRRAGHRCGADQTQGPGKRAADGRGTGPVCPTKRHWA
jgi:hypothetical protein